MPSGKTVKLVLFEVLQFAAVSVPLFVVMERFAGLMRDLKGQEDRTAYWLVVAASVAYVTSVTLLVWVPLKYLMLKRRRFITKIKLWRPTALAYVILCPLPCFAFLMAASKVQVDAGQQLDHFTELPVSLVLLCLICVDVVERIRTCSLTGKADSSPDSDFDLRGPVLTHLERVTTVTGQLQHHHHHDDAISQNDSPSPAPTDAITTTATTTINGTPAARRYRSDDDPHRQPTVNPRAYLYSPTPRSGPLRFLWSRDVRSEAFVDGFLFWLDTAEMLRAAADPRVFYTAWVFPVFTLAFLSTLRLAQNPLTSSSGVALQDFPFLVLRVALLAAFGGDVTPALYAAKNLLVCLSYVYFTFLARVVKRHSMF
ncbi:Transmembrane protein 236 [Merluccius polli]|uniref:Transmembrane protein 236 n=1 Tax=Merluccius polli TaxID=89951 RepID=A0AA47NR75_MERPO|nr:Transmembrane protein 236 [Merluccius polli]